MPKITVDTESINQVIAFCLPDANEVELKACFHTAKGWSARDAREHRDRLIQEICDCFPEVPSYQRYRKARDMADAIAVALRVCYFSSVKSRGR